LSFNYGIFPDSLKVAAVNPIFENGEKDTVSNYHPISVLPCLSKILEKLIKMRLISFMEKHHIFYQHQ